jgi:hypothetical protein
VRIFEAAKRHEAIGASPHLLHHIQEVFVICFASFFAHAFCMGPQEIPECFARWILSSRGTSVLPFPCGAHPKGTSAEAMQGE